MQHFVFDFYGKNEYNNFIAIKDNIIADFFLYLCIRGKQQKSKNMEWLD